MRIWRLGLAAVAGLLAGAAVASAAAFGALRVASHLGEPLVAEVPIVLAEGERPEDVRVDVASPEDYQILEVYRDPAVDRVRVQVVQDQRGLRVKITSAGALDTPFFNLVLKLAAGPITQFKKFPVFLDPPPAVAPGEASQPAKPQPKPVQAKAVPAPAVPAARPAAPAASKAVPVGKAAPAASASLPFRPYGGWARSRGVYGPVVYGDTLITIARRLRVDERFTVNQVMVALFRKNPQAFGENNINILKAGAMLKVPTAEEVAAIPPAEADRIVRAHNRRWEVLKRTRPEYARLAEAQRTRYMKRVRVGRLARGVPAAPAPEKARPAKKAVPAPRSAPTQPLVASKQVNAQLAALRKELEEVKARNEQLAAQLSARDARIAELEKQLKEKKAAPVGAAGELEAELAATKEQLRKLKIRLARVQAELAKARRARAETPFLRPLDYALIGVIVVLLGVIGLLLARQRKAPPAAAPEEPMEAGATAAAAAAAAGAAAGAAAAAAASEEEEIPEIEVEEVPAPQAAEKEIGTDTVPDLTEEDTGAMEPFITGEAEEEEAPDPNVDYLSEADVFLRYGLEDEAEKQVRMALKLDEHNPKAWAKLVEVARAKGDENAAAQAEAEAREKLSGEALATFERLLAGAAEGQEGEPEQEEKTMIVSKEELLEDTASSAAPASEAPEEEKKEEDELATVAMDLGLEDAMMSVEEETAPSEQPAGEGAQAAGEEELALELGKAEEAAPAEEEKAPEAGAQEQEEGLDFDLSGLDLGEEEKPAAEEGAPAQEEAPDTQASEEEGLDFDLGDLELGEEETAKEEQEEEATQALVSEEAQTSEQATVVLEEQETTEAEAQEEGLQAPELTLEGIALSEEEPAAQSEQEEKAEEATQVLAAEEEPALTVQERAPQVEEEPAAQEEEEPVLELGEEDIGLELDEALSEAATEVDEFTSTIQTTVLDTGGKAKEEGAKDTKQEEDKEVDLSTEVGDVEDLDLDALMDELGLDTEENKKDKNQDKGA